MTPRDLSALQDHTDRAELAGTVRAMARPFSISEARTIGARLRELRGSAQRLRLAVLHSYTSELLDPWLHFQSALDDLDLDVYHAPYGWFRQEGEPGSGLRAHQADLCLLMMQPGDLHPALSGTAPTLGPAARREVFAAALAELRTVLEVVRSATQGLIVFSLLPGADGPAMGLFDALAEQSEARDWSDFKRDLARVLRDEYAGCAYLDLDEMTAEIGRAAAFDRRLWLTARFPFSPHGAQEFARRAMVYGALLRHPRVKVVVVDADNTLWGGVIGEDGMEGIALGPDYPGNAYVLFQKKLLDLTQRGLLLAMCSKNNEADVDEVLQRHPHMLLRAEHFVARRVNWLPKAQNLESLAEELNLGLDSFVFVDDSEHECMAVRQALPQVEVVRVPSQALGVPTCLDAVARLQTLKITAEDLRKTRMYAEERERQSLAREFAGSGASIEEFLKSLQMHLRVSIGDTRQIPRLSQLTQKTNQFNLTTRRYNEEQVRAFMLDPHGLVAHFTLEDRFGNSGVVGLAILVPDQAATMRLDTFLMSCRVIGRQAEFAFLDTLLGVVAGQGVRALVGEFLPTAKNKLAADFLSNAGFVQGPDQRWHRPIDPAAGSVERPMRISIDRPGVPH